MAQEAPQPDPKPDPHHPAHLDLTLPAELPAVQLPGVTVYGTLDPLKRGDARLKRQTDALPCMGCDGVVRDPTPLVVNFAKAAALKVLRGTLFKQPHVREEPNDEALILAHQYLCTAENPFGCFGSDKMP